MFDMDFGRRDCLLIFSHFQCVMFWALDYQPICIGILQATICYASCCMRKFRSLQRLPSPGDCVPSCVGIRVLALWTHFVWYLQNNSWLSFCTDADCNTLSTAPVYHVQQLFDEKYCRNVLLVGQAQQKIVVTSSCTSAMSEKDHCNLKIIAI
jgi:hypothetical protein